MPDSFHFGNFVFSYFGHLLFVYFIWKYTFCKARRAKQKFKKRKSRNKNDEKMKNKVTKIWNEPGNYCLKSENCLNPFSEYSQTTTSLPSTTTKVSQLARQPKVLADKPTTPSSGLVLSLPQQSQTNIPEGSGSASNIVKIDPINLSSILIFFVFLLL